ncbi:MAG: flagellar hook-basal body complex protein FliE [Actinomycetes bacterium]
MSVMGIGAISGANGAAAAMSVLGGALGASETSATSGLASAGGASALAGAPSSSGVNFGNALTQAVDGLQATQSTADTLAIQASTGDLKDVHDYTIAATEASLATDLTVALRNKAIESFNEIMRMPV